jgi:hypothetical protein
VDLYILLYIYIYTYKHISIYMWGRLIRRTRIFLEELIVTQLIKIKLSLLSISRWFHAWFILWPWIWRGLRPEELGKFKNFIHLIGSRTRNLPAYRIVP